MQDLIQREIMIQATPQRIYAAIADPEQVIKWFPETLEGDYSVGAQPVFGFGEHGKTQVYVVAANPFEYFAYRWVPGANHFLGDVLKVASTLVEFRITEQADGRCKVTMTESGFAALPKAMMADALKQNTGGWEFMMNRLSQLFNSAA
jgi:uncharacterized protein YndB with AHSA1/START domain